jgi:3-hydroxyisobutyrate dehydrogenase
MGRDGGGHCAATGGCAMTASARARSAAVLGTGIMGGAMARNMARAGIAVGAWNRHRARADALAKDGVEVFDDAADAVSGRDAVLTMLPDVSVVRTVMSRDVFAALTDQAVWVQSSTVGIAGAEQLIELARRMGVRLLDAPVSGTRSPAEAGQLVVLASGDDENALEFCRPLFDAVAVKTMWLGEAGNGSRMKLVTNDWVLGQTALLAEAIRLCEGLGLAAETFLASIDGAPVGSTYAQVKGRMMVAGDFDPNFPLVHAAKDTRFILRGAEDAGLELPVAAATAEHFAASLARGSGEQDVAAIYREAGAPMRA